MQSVLDYKFEWMCRACVRVCSGGAYSGFKTRAILDNKVYNAVYRIILFLLLQYILPMMLLVVLNARVVVSLRQATIHRASTLRVDESTTPRQQSAAVSASMFESTRRVTLIVVIVVLLCIVCHLVAMAARAWLPWQRTCSGRWSWRSGDRCRSQRSGRSSSAGVISRASATSW